MSPSSLDDVGFCSARKNVAPQFLRVNGSFNIRTVRDKVVVSKWDTCTDRRYDVEGCRIECACFPNLSYGNRDSLPFSLRAFSPVTSLRPAARTFRDVSPSTRRRHRAG
eukprot:3571049-Prymnesium_polylepis.2